MQQTTPVRLPIVAYEIKRWYFDTRLRQIRNVEDPQDYQDLNDFEMEYFEQLVKRVVRLVWKDEGIDSEGRMFGPAYTENAAGEMIDNFGWITLKKAMERAEALGVELETV